MRLIDYLPEQYRYSAEIAESQEAFEKWVKLFLAAKEDLFAQFFVSTATWGLKTWEKVVDIIADPTVEDIEFRRARVIARLTTTTPCTEAVFVQMMDSIMGAGNWWYTYGSKSWGGVYLGYDSWEHVMDGNETWEDVCGLGRDYWIDIYTINPGRNWKKEVDILLRRILPAHIGWTLHLVTSSWIEVYEENESWEAVHDRFDDWESVYYGANEDEITTGTGGSA